ncbi:MAG: Gfo/Idh/MocA family protein [Verrucomicrobiales bacterium]
MTKKLAIFGCGDFLRWQLPALKTSSQVEVDAVFDPDNKRAEKFAAELGCDSIADPESIFADPAIDMVALFVPPLVRKDLFLKAAKAGKHVICTKPLGSMPADCEEMIQAADASGIRAGVIYGRTGDIFVESCKKLFEDGRLGKLALYKQDWIHAYPKWNSWATDPEKNGGPFMDAMIHNLNAACYLMDRPITETSFFSDRLSHPDMKCADTESMVVRYEGGGVANLFITWAADLATHSTDGNDREHIDLLYLVTDKGYRLTKEWKDGAPVIQASRDGKTETIPCTSLEVSHYDAFAAHIEGAPLPSVLADLESAALDVRLIRNHA